MSTYHFLQTKEIGILTILECETFICKNIRAESIKSVTGLSYFDGPRLLYKGDKNSIEKTHKTLVAVDNTNELYGLASVDRNGKKRLVMVDENSLNKLMRKGDIANEDRYNLIDINSRFKDGYLDSNLKSVFSRISFLNLCYGTYEMGYEKWLEYKNKKEDKSSEKLDEPSNTEDKQIDKTDEQKRDVSTLSKEEILNLPEVKQIICSLEDRERSLSNRESIIMLKEEDLRRKNISLDEHKQSLEISRSNFELKEQATKDKIEQDLRLLESRRKQLEEKESSIRKQKDIAQDIVNRLNESIVNSSNLNSCDIDEIIISVKDIFTFKEPQVPKRDVNTVFPDFTYELILKSLSTGDIINVPKRYVETLSRQFITMADKSEYDIVYSSIENIMFNENASEFITAILEYHKKEDTVRVYICKEFSNVSLDNAGISYYKANYAKMKKMMRVLYGEE